MAHAEVCPVCKGSGMVNDDIGIVHTVHIVTCHSCGGSGWVTVQDNRVYPYIDTNARMKESKTMKLLTDGIQKSLIDLRNLDIDLGTARRRILTSIESSQKAERKRIIKEVTNIEGEASSDDSGDGRQYYFIEKNSLESLKKRILEGI